MKERTRKIFIMIVMAALIVSLMAASFAALTYGRYSGGRRDENSAYEDILDLVGETAFEVSTADELVNAINNGYSYIKIAADAEEPFVVNNNVADVYTNLVLDVNGHKIVRNSRNPLLNVRQSVSVVLVYDSSTDADGGFYNPVGSSLQTSGGTLTVGEGVYESGPRAEEDGANNQKDDYIGGVLNISDQVKVAVYSRDESINGYPESGQVNRAAGEEGAGYVIAAPNASMPRIFVPEGHSGNYYRSSGGSWQGNDWIPEDTFLLYTVEKNAFVGNGSGDFENGQLYVNAEETANADGTTTVTAEKFSPVCNVASCDFYYYYPIEDDDNDGYQNYAVIYGYWDVKALASNEKGAAETLQESGLVWPYAAIRSEAGVTHARGGEFYTYFGEENTYSIYSEGGTMTVGLSGESSEPPEFQAIGKGVCINMEGQETGAQRSAPSLTIENGDFSSTLGDTIKMSGGEMEVKKGSFTKNAAVSGAASGDGASNGSAISISGGTLNMKGSETDGEKSVSFTVNGNYVNGIKMEKAEDDATANIADTIKNAAFSFNNKSYGNSVAAIQVIGGALNVSDSTFTVNGFGNFGVYSSGGTVTATDCTFTMTQAGDPSGGRGDNFGIYSMRPEGATKGGTATAEGCTINITGTYSAGVLSMDGTLNLGASKTKETLITVSFEGNELSSSGVSSEGGEINLTGNTTITSAGLGITARGEINVTGGTSTVETKRGTGIYVQNGTLTISEGATVEVDSKINDTCSWVVPPEHTGEESLQTNKYNGVFVNGGSLKSEGELNVTFTGVENENRGTYLDQQIKSYAVRVEGTTGTTVTIVSGNILNGSYDENGNVKENSGVGGGVYVGGGTVTLGKQETTNSVTTYSGPTVQTTGELLFAEVTKNEGSWPWYETTYTWEGWKNVVGDFWQYMLNKSGGHAVEVSGGSLTVHGGNYTAQQGNGILIRNTSDVKTTNTVKINSGSFLGYNSGYYVAYGYEQTPLGGDRMVGPAASYGLNVMGHDLDVTINGGTFGETGKTGNSAASFFGTPAGSRPQVAVHGGTFNANNADAISVFRFIDITFDGEVSSEVSGETDVASLSVQNDFLYTGESARGSTITIQSGTFTGTAYGIWYGSSTDKLNIYGGRFTGAARSGLYFEVNQWNGSLQKGNTLITGGTFIGISSPHGDYWTNGAIGAPSSGINEGVGYSIQIVDFIDCNSGKSIYYFEDSDSQQADNVTALSWYANNKDNRDVNKINQTTCKYNKVIIQ